jgi:ABC-2 type transport system permease protein
VQGATLSIGMSQLVIAVLGALVITGEYGTGMIRSTLTAVPYRLPALFGKIVVFGVVTFVISFVSIVVTALLSAPLLAGNGIEVDFTDGAYWIALLGAAGYLALSGVLAIVSIFAVVTMQEWVATISTFLPSNAGARMYAYVSEALSDPMGLGGVILEPWQGGLVLVAWIAALLVLASVLLKRRDA